MPQMPDFSACCTCATPLTVAKVPYDPDSDQPLVEPRRLACCSRTICATCQHQNPRFQSYCPFCQISSVPTALPSEGLRLPPSYTQTGQSAKLRREPSPPPSYLDSLSTPRLTENSAAPPKDTEDTVHHVSSDDSLTSLSLAYSVPLQVLRQHNMLFSDSLLSARKCILIPASHYSGPSLSTPPDPEEEERKTKLRRWMVATKCADYNVAALYLKGSDYSLELATEAFRADEAWERAHPLQGKTNAAKGGKPGRRHGQGGSMVGQLF